MATNPDDTNPAGDAPGGDAATAATPGGKRPRRRRRGGKPGAAGASPQEAGRSPEPGQPQAAGVAREPRGERPPKGPKGPKGPRGPKDGAAPREAGAPQRAKGPRPRPAAGGAPVRRGPDRPHAARRPLPLDEHGDVNGNVVFERAPADAERQPRGRPGGRPGGGQGAGPGARQGRAGGEGRFPAGGRPARPQGGAPGPRVARFGGGGGDIGNEAAPAAAAPGRAPPGKGGGQGGRRARGAPAELDSEPVRLHKILAQMGVGSRRELEDWILAGRISVNGKPAEVGQLVKASDRIKVNGRLINVNFSERMPRVLIYNKPEGEIVSRDDPEGRPSVFDALPRINGGRWIAVGRLDFNTSGLLVFTTSGELANRLMHPRYEIVREYAVRILGDLDEEAKHELIDGVMLEDGMARFHILEEAGGEGANRWYRVVLHEGRNREVRRMFELVGATVSRLMRVRYGPLLLPPTLRRGKVGELDERQVKELLEAVGMAAPRPRFVR